MTFILSKRDYFASWNISDFLSSSSGCVSSIESALTYIGLADLGVFILGVWNPLPVCDVGKFFIILNLTASFFRSKHNYAFKPVNLLFLGLLFLTISSSYSSM